MSRKKKLTGAILSCAVVFTMGLTALAATNAGTSFTYGSETVLCKLNVTWKVGKDEGYAKTYAQDGNSGSYPLGAYANAYSNGTLLGGKNATAFDSVQTANVTYTADEYRSTHNIQNSNRVPLKSAKLSLE